MIRLVALQTPIHIAGRDLATQPREHWASAASDSTGKVPVLVEPSPFIYRDAGVAKAAQKPLTNESRAGQ